MDCQRGRMLITVGLLAIASGCGREQGGTPPDAGNPPSGVSPISYRSGSETEELAEFLRNPPRLTSELQRIVARQWRRRMETAGLLDVYRDELRSLERGLRNEGLLLDAADLRSLAWKDGRLIPWSSPGSGLGRLPRDLESSISNTQSKPAVARAVNKARGQLENVQSELEILGIELVFRAADVTKEKRFDELFNSVDGIEGFDFLLSKQGAERLRAAYRTWSAASNDYERHKKDKQPLAEDRRRLRQASESVAKLQREAVISWREVFAASEESWEELTGDWDSISPGLTDEIGSRLATIETIGAAAQRITEAEITETQSEFARLARDASRIEAGIQSYLARAGREDSGGEESAGVADALELAMQALERLQQRRIAAELVAKAQSVPGFEAAAIGEALHKDDVAWGDIVTAVGVELASFEGEVDAHFPAKQAPGPFLARELQQALQRDATHNRAVAADAGEQYQQLKSKTSALGQQALTSVEAIRDGVAEAQQDVETILEADADVSTARLRMEIARDLMHDSQAAADRIGEIESREVLYEPLSDEARSEILVALERHQRREGEGEQEDKEDKENGEADSSQKKWGERIGHAEEAVKAAKDVTEMLVLLDVVPVEDANKVLRGLDAASAGLTVATGLMSGNVFDVISGGAQLVSILSGREPPPSIEELRHEQIMDALGALGEGQQAIMEGLEAISRQIHQLGQEVDAVQQIVMATHRLLIEDRLQGLRLARDFVEARRFYTDRSVAGAAVSTSGQSIPQDYEQWTAHFQKHRQAYAEGRRFLDDQVRENPLEMLQLANDLSESESVAALGGMPSNWAGALKEDKERIDALRAFANWIDPDVREAVLGSLVHPAASQAALERKLALIAESDPEATEVWRAAWSEAALERNLWKRFNPLLLAEISELLVALQPYRLIDEGHDFSGRMPSFAKLSSPGYDPSQSFGSSPKSRHDQLTRPVRDAELLLMEATAQNALVQGDVLLPVLAMLTMSDSLRCDHAGVQAAAERVLLSHPMLRHNALRFLVYLNLHHGMEERERVVAHAVSLLKPEVRDQLRPVRLPMPASRAELRKRYRDIVGQPLPASPGWLLLSVRLPDSWSMQHLLAVADRKGAASWGRTIYGLDLKVTNPLSYDDADEGTPESPDRRFGSPAVVTWWHELGKQEAAETKELWAKRLRLPSDSDAQAGSLLTTDLSDVLSRAVATVREARSDLDVTYSPKSRTAAADRLARESWFRLLTEEASRPRQGSHSAEPSRVADRRPESQPTDKR